MPTLRITFYGGPFDGLVHDCSPTVPVAQILTLFRDEEPRLQTVYRRRTVRPGIPVVLEYEMVAMTATA
jgi:hypothetical protein